LAPFCSNWIWGRAPNRRFRDPWWRKTVLLEHCFEIARLLPSIDAFDSSHLHFHHILSVSVFIPHLYTMAEEEAAPKPPTTKEKLATIVQGFDEFDLEMKRGTRVSI
jgi:hypothetical protein